MYSLFTFCHVVLFFFFYGGDAWFPVESECSSTVHNLVSLLWTQVSSRGSLYVEVISLGASSECSSVPGKSENLTLRKNLNWFFRYVEVIQLGASSECSIVLSKSESFTLRKNLTGVKVPFLGKTWLARWLLRPVCVVNAIWFCNCEFLLVHGIGCCMMPHTKNAYTILTVERHFH